MHANKNTHLILNTLRTKNALNTIMYQPKTLCTHTNKIIHKKINSHRYMHSQTNTNSQTNK